MSNQENYTTDLQEIVSENYDQIKAGTYEWSDDEVEAVYKFINSYASKLKFKNQLDKEDFIQDNAYKFFSKFIKGYDISKQNKISTYTYRCMENEYKMQLKRGSTKLYLTTTSLNELVDNSNHNGNDKEVEKVDLLEDDVLKSSEYYVSNKWENFLSEEFPKTVLLKEVEFNGKNQTSLAKQYNVDQTYISKIVRIERFIILLRAIYQNIPIPDKYDVEIENMKKSIDKHKQTYKNIANENNYKKIEEYYVEIINNFVERKINNQSNKQMQ